MSRSSAADGSESICCDENFAPIRYHWYREADSDLSILGEIRAILAREPDLTPTLIDGFIGDVKARLRLLSEGRLRPVDQVKGPMESETRFQLFEVKFKFEFGTAGEVMVRAYHVEPKEFARVGRKGSIVVGLHVHKKTDDAAQDAEIVLAGKKYFAGRAAKWGAIPGGL